MLPAPRSIVAQLLLLLVLTVILVVTAGSLFSYQSTAAANQKAVLASLQMDAERRAAVDSQVFVDVEHNLTQCAGLIRRRLAAPPPAPPWPRNEDGTVRLAPEGPDLPLAGFLTHRAGENELARRRFAAALEILQELGASWCRQLPAIAIARPGDWIASWGTAYAELSASMLPDDPILLASEAELLARPEPGVRWSRPYLEPATDLQCVSALLPVEVAGVRVAIYHPVPVAALLAQVGQDMPGSTLTVVLDQHLHPIACPRSQPDPKPGTPLLEESTTLKLPPRLARALAGSVFTQTGIYPAAAGDGWLAVSRLNGPGWFVVTHLPPEYVNDAAERSAWAVLMVGGLILGVLIIAITVVVEFNIARPINALQEDVAILAAGGRPNRARSPRRDEIGVLGATFDRMAHEVADIHASLREALVELGRREEMYRTVFAAADALLVIRDGRIVEANVRAGALFALATDQLVGRTLVELAPERQADDEPSTVRLERLSHGATGGFHAWRARRPEGNDIDVEIGFARVTRPNGELLVVALHDVTERNSLDMQLRQMQKMETVGQLAGGVAHDFNNLLAGILGSAELLGRRLGSHPDQAKAKELVGRILQAGDRAAELVRKLMSFARKGRQVSTPLDVHEVIRETCALLERSIDRRIALRLDLDAEDQVVLGDTAMLQSALLNLGVNARDAMPEGGTLTFTTRNLDLGAEPPRPGSPGLMAGRYLEILVSDNGTGMPPEVLNRLFEPFFTTKPLGKGTGLGLASVLRTIQDHHGRVEVFSTAGAGTTFRLLLPLSQQNAQSHTTAPLPVVGKGRILVVDDDDLVRGTAVEMLRSLGYQVDEARDGLEGIAAYRPGQHDLALLDMEMPGARGIDCLRGIRTRDPQVRALLCSGFARDESASELHSAGFLGFLKKPFRLFDLSNAVATALKTPANR